MLGDATLPLGNFSPWVGTPPLVILTLSGPVMVTLFGQYGISPFWPLVVCLFIHDPFIGNYDLLLWYITYFGTSHYHSFEACPATCAPLFNNHVLL